MDDMDSGDESDHDIISTDMLEEICDVSQNNPNVNSRETRYEICDRIKQKRLEWKGALKPRKKWVKVYTRYLRPL